MPGRGRPARLHGWRRGWGVAMDNAETIPGYKVYVAADGSRPDVCVAFLDVREQPGAAVNGACVEVDAATLAALDDRERNYVRVDVTGQVEPALGRTWVYAGRADSRERYAAALAAGRCVVARPYAELVEQGFRALGGWDEFLASTDDHRPPLADLVRVDTSPGGRAEPRPQRTPMPARGEAATA